MDLSKILSISGKPGLYRHVGQSKNGIVVESIIDGKRSSAFASDQISALNDISMYTTGEDVKLEEVFTNIYKKEDGKPTISEKSSANELKSFFKEILPDYDEDRVYISDIKKVIKWYNIMSTCDIPEFTIDEKEDNDKVEETNESNTNIEEEDENKKEKVNDDDE